MIDIPMLRKLGTGELDATKEILQEACLQAAENNNELCKHIDGCVRVAAAALKRVKELEAELAQGRLQ